jgi:hypothetical protein
MGWVSSDAVHLLRGVVGRSVFCMLGFFLSCVMPPKSVFVVLFVSHFRPSGGVANNIHMTRTNIQSISDFCSDAEGGWCKLCTKRLELLERRAAPVLTRIQSDHPNETSFCFFQKKKNPPPALLSRSRAFCTVLLSIATLT